MGKELSAPPLNTPINQREGIVFFKQFTLFVNVLGKREKPVAIVIF